MVALTAVYSRKMVNFLHTTREENYYSCKEMDHPKKVAPEIGEQVQATAENSIFTVLVNFYVLPLDLYNSLAQ